MTYVPPQRLEVRAVAQHIGRGMATGKCQYQNATTLPNHPAISKIILNKSTRVKHSGRRTFTSVWHSRRNKAAQNVSGKVKIQVIVNPKGKVAACYIAQSSNNFYWDTEVCIRAYKLAYYPVLNRSGQAAWGNKIETISF